MLGQTEGYLILSLLGQISAKGMKIGNFSTVGQSRGAVDLGIRTGFARRVEMFKGQAPGVDPRMALGATPNVPVSLKFFS